MKLQQLSIFSVLQQITDIELITRNIEKLQIGDSIITVTCDIERNEKMLTVRAKEFEETFKTGTEALMYIKNYFENGPEYI